MHIPASRMRSAEKRVPVSVRGGARQGLAHRPRVNNVKKSKSCRVCSFNLKHAFLDPEDQGRAFLLIEGFEEQEGRGSEVTCALWSVRSSIRSGVGKEEHVSIGVVWGQMPIPKGLVNKRCAVVKRM
jgi:hypothetical protein